MSANTVNYTLGECGEFIVKNYNLSRPFSGFFPGIAGRYGKPMWAFYVNRAQGICSMGTNGKDGSILEFQPANKAYTLTSTYGFRTFLKVQKDNNLHFYEPFTEASQYNRENFLSIGSSTVYIEEKNHTLGITVSVKYFCIPGEPFSALARELTIHNNTDTNMSIELADGLPFIIPFGVTEGLAKSMSHTLQAWMHVLNLDKRIPIYKLKVEVADKPVVTKIEKGSFYFACHFPEDNKLEALPPIIDPSLIFGTTIDLRTPYRFFCHETFELPQNQVSEGITPSAFGYLKFELNAHSKKEVYSLIGHADTETAAGLSKIVSGREYFDKKLNEAQQIIHEIQDNMLTESSSYAFNLYCKNTFLDNILRGGYPVTLQAGKQSNVLHLYTRRHGDIERDYNSFSIQPSYYSQGDGNFRDICQNRRNDVWFNPDVSEDNIKTFVNLIQLDGYNPLQLKGDRFIARKTPKELIQLKDFIKQAFTLGELLEFVEKNKINLGINNEDLIKLVISISDKNTEANYREGYWVDHWTYITDLLDSYRSVYPDKYPNIFNSNDYTFFDSPAVVAPKKDKIKIKDGKIRQYGGVIEDDKKAELIQKRTEEPNKVRTKYGKGKIYKTSLLVKLLTLIANKYATLDPFGIGIEMEADRPGWYDALNGLPGLFGSSTCETFELKRLIIYVKEALSNIKDKKLCMPVEIADFLESLFKGVNKKELYREKTKFGIKGKEKALPIDKLNSGLDKMLKELLKAADKAYDEKTGLYNTYYTNEVTSIKPLRYKHRPLPNFLEGQVHALRLMSEEKEARKLYNAVRKSGLYDEKLKMYKVNASLKDESLELGRVKVFTPGWLENESIWVHMEYKYLLELLRNDLYAEFYTDFKNALIPFQKPEIFGRNILESCSFIVSSAHPDNSLHGVGFLPRLTGATAEFIHMWLWMCIGKKPFFVKVRSFGSTLVPAPIYRGGTSTAEFVSPGKPGSLAAVNSNGDLNMTFQPILSDWLFTDEGTFGFNLFGSTRVVYHNPQKKNTFGPNAAKPFRIMLDAVTIEGDTVPAPHAEEIRNRKIKRIDIYLG